MGRKRNVSLEGSSKYKSVVGALEDGEEWIPSWAYDEIHTKWNPSLEQKRKAKRIRLEAELLQQLRENGVLLHHLMRYGRCRNPQYRVMDWSNA